MIRSLLVVFVIALSPNFASADIVITAPPNIPVSNSDVFDISNGTTVIASSAIASPFDARSAFGYIRPGGVEPDNTYFQDVAPVGTIDFLTIRTPTAVSVTGFKMFTYDDTFPGGAGAARGMSQFRMLASNDGTTFAPVETASLGTDYTSTYGNSSILVTATFAPILAQYFRFEATRSTVFGPRIQEIDAITAVPEPASLALVLAGLGALACTQRKRSNKALQSSSRLHRAQYSVEASKYRNMLFEFRSRFMTQLRTSRFDIFVPTKRNIMLSKSLLGHFSFAATVLLFGNFSQAGLMTSFESALQAGTPSPGWSYMWNSSGPIGNELNYTNLIATNLPNALYTNNGGVVPGPAPGGYVFMGITDTFNNLTISTGAFTNVPGGHPGYGINQAQSGGIERYSIANFTVSSSGYYVISNSLLANSDSSVDGLNLRVYVNDFLVTSGTTAPGQDSTITFDTTLGNLVVGDNIYVAVGSNLTDGNDEFALRYSISAVPEPGSLILSGIASIISLAAHRKRRCKNKGMPPGPQESRPLR